MCSISLVKAEKEIKLLQWMSEQLNLSCSPQTCPWTQRRYQRKPPCWWLCCLLQNKRQFCRIPPSLAAAKTPETGALGGCFPKSSTHAGVKGHKRLIHITSIGLNTPVQFEEGYTHDNSKTVLSSCRHLLTGWANVLDGGVKVVQIWCDSPLVYYSEQSSVCTKQDSRRRNIIHFISTKIKRLSKCSSCSGLILNMYLPTFGCERNHG